MPTSIHYFRYGINRVFVIRQKGTIMIDAGPPGIAGKFEKDLLKEGIKPDSIKLMVLTHGDFDHSGSAASIKRLTGCDVAVHSKDRHLVEKGMFNWPPGTTPWGKFTHMIFAPLMRRIKMEPVKPDLILPDENFPLHEYGIDGQVVYTPGHTQGHVSVVLDEGIAFIGCLSHNIKLFRLRPNLPIYAENIEEVKSSWKKILNMGITEVYPAHGKSFNSNRIRKHLPA